MSTKTRKPTDTTLRNLVKTRRDIAALRKRVRAVEQQLSAIRRVLPWHR